MLTQDNFPLNDQRTAIGPGGQMLLKKQKGTKPPQLFGGRQTAQQIAAEDSRRQPAKASILCFAAVPKLPPVPLRLSLQLLRVS